MHVNPALIPALLCLIDEHAGIGARMRAQIVRCAHKVQAAGTMIAEADQELQQIAQGQQELSRSVQMMMRAVQDSGLSALPPVRQAAGRIEAMVEGDDCLFDDTASASTLLQQVASQLTLIAAVLGDCNAPDCRPQSPAPAPASAPTRPAR